MHKPYQTHLTRKGRYSEYGRIYLLTSVTKDRQPFFSDWRIAILLAKQFEQSARDDLAGSLAWVVMPDHFHWLVELKDT